MSPDLTCQNPTTEIHTIEATEVVLSETPVARTGGRFPLTVRRAIASAVVATTAYGCFFEPVARETIELLSTSWCDTERIADGGSTVECYLRLPTDPTLEIATEPSTAAGRITTTLHHDSLGTRAVTPHWLTGKWRLPPEWIGPPLRLTIHQPEGEHSQLQSLRLIGNKVSRQPLLSWQSTPPSGQSTATAVTDNSPTGAPRDNKRRYNILVYVIDTLRVDRMSLYGYQRPTTPLIADWASEAFVFEKAYSTGSKTLEAVPALLASRTIHAGHLQPQQEQRKSKADEPVLAEVLRSAGYRTAAFQANFLLALSLGYARGFDTYDLIPGVDNPHGATAPVDADEVHARALRWLDETDEPFFMYIQTMDPHTPYAAPKGFSGRFATSDSKDRTPLSAKKALDESGKEYTRDEAEALQTVLDNLWRLDPDRHDECIAYADYAFRHFLGELDKRGTLDDTIIVVTADHGESLGDGPVHEMRLLHGLTLYEEIVRVPLIIKLPRQTHGKRIAELASILDIAPTVLDAAGLRVPLSFEGRSLFAIPSHRSIGGFRRNGTEIVDTFVRNGKWKLMRNRETDQLFDLLRDPLETTDLSKINGVALGFMRNRLANLTERTTASQARAAALTDSEREKINKAMRALGYAE